MRILNFSDGFSSNSEPTLGTINANSILTFASDAAFVAYKTLPAAIGDIYFNSTLNHVRWFDGTVWVSALFQDASGNVVVIGNLTVQGTTTTVNAVNLEVKDKNITINKTGTDATAQGAGITVERVGTNGSIIYDSTLASKWKAGDEGAESEVITAGAAQTLANKIFGNKATFNAEILGAAADITTAGSGVTIAAPGVLVNNLIGALTSLSGITAVTGVQPLILVNKTGSDLIVKNEDATATAANRIITGTANDLTFKSLASLWLIYDLTAARWRVVGGSGGSNIVVASSLSLAASGTLTLDPTSTVQSILIQGASAPVTLSTTPFGSTAPQNGTVVKLIGNSDLYMVTIPTSDVAKGVIGYSATLAKGQTGTYEYNSTLDRYVILGVSN